VLLLESSDYSSKEESLSFICFGSMANIISQNGKTTISGIDLNPDEFPTLVSQVEAFLHFFDSDDSKHENKYNGIFGFTGFDAVQHFEKIKFNNEKPNYPVPQLRYDLYKYVVVFDHFYDRVTVLENRFEGEESSLSSILSIINSQSHSTYSFQVKGKEASNMTGEQFKKNVTKAKYHCQRGDIFQMVPARRFEQAFIGDEFSVYRALRSINPSPYLFYFDYGNYKIFGSSPEAQMIVKDRIAEIHPIAGTFKRTGDIIQDNELARKLLADPKENAEHIMLVDLARNDLSKNTVDVKVHKYKEVQYFSHVIHLVSVVKGELKKDISSFQIFADTFPAGTLSGAPKYKAMTLIDEVEPTARSFYGGGIGMIGFNEDLNHAIMIRSFLSVGGKLYFQAGAGIVIDSDEEKELQEVNNKLAALKKALDIAQKI
jgi:anthranilate synthase component 1